MGAASSFLRPHTGPRASRAPNSTVISQESASAMVSPPQALTAAPSLSSSAIGPSLSAAPARPPIHPNTQIVSSTGSQRMNPTPLSLQPVEPTLHDSAQSSSPMPASPKASVVDLSANIPYTPTGSEAEIFKYYCPLCMLHFKNILKTHCCANTMCFACTKDYLATKGLEEIKTVHDFTIQAILLDEITCPHCFTTGFHPMGVKADEEVRDYSQRDAPGVKYYQPSPVRVGESFEDLKRKMITFQQASSSSVAPTSRDTPTHIPEHGPAGDDGDGGEAIDCGTERIAERERVCDLSHTQSQSQSLTQSQSFSRSQGIAMIAQSPLPLATTNLSSTLSSPRRDEDEFLRLSSLAADHSPRPHTHSDTTTASRHSSARSRTREESKAADDDVVRRLALDSARSAHSLTLTQTLSHTQTDKDVRVSVAEEKTNDSSSWPVSSQRKRDSGRGTPCARSPRVEEKEQAAEMAQAKEHEVEVDKDVDEDLLLDDDRPSDGHTHIDTLEDSIEASTLSLARINMRENFSLAANDNARYQEAASLFVRHVMDIAARQSPIPVVIT